MSVSQPINVYILPQSTLFRLRNIFIFSFFTRDNWCLFPGWRDTLKRHFRYVILPKSHTRGTLGLNYLYSIRGIHECATRPDAPSIDYTRGPSPIGPLPKTKTMHASAPMDFAPKVGRGTILTGHVPSNMMNVWNLIRFKQKFQTVLDCNIELPSDSQRTLTMYWLPSRILKI